MILFRRLSEWVFHRQYVLKFKNFWIWSKGGGKPNRNIVSIFSFFLVMAPHSLIFNSRKCTHFRTDQCCFPSVRFVNLSGILPKKLIRFLTLLCLGARAPLEPLDEKEKVKSQQKKVSKLLDLAWTARRYEILFETFRDNGS